jgi:hypothetical protein
MFNKMVNGVQCTIALFHVYVDDLLITCQDESVIGKSERAKQPKMI